MRVEPDLTPDLRIIPFCSFNVIPEWYRDKIQQKYGLPYRCQKVS